MVSTNCHAMITGVAYWVRPHMRFGCTWGRSCWVPLTSGAVLPTRVARPRCFSTWPALPPLAALGRCVPLIPLQGGCMIPYLRCSAKMALIGTPPPISKPESGVFDNYCVLRMPSSRRSRSSHVSHALSHLHRHGPNPTRGANPSDVDINGAILYLQKLANYRSLVAYSCTAEDNRIAANDVSHRNKKRLGLFYDQGRGGYRLRALTGHRARIGQAGNHPPVRNPTMLLQGSTLENASGNITIVSDHRAQTGHTHGRLLVYRTTRPISGECLAQGGTARYQ